MATWHERSVDAQGALAWCFDAQPQRGGRFLTAWRHVASTFSCRGVIMYCVGVDRSPDGQVEEKEEE